MAYEPRHLVAPCGDRYETMTERSTARGHQTEGMADAIAALPDVATSRCFDRRTLLLGAAGALVAAGVPASARAERYAASVAAGSGPRFDPVLARRLQRVLRDALHDPSTHFPGAILYVHSRKLGTWTGVVGRGRVAPAEPMRAADRFRAGSIAKTFVAVVVLQLAERGRVSLDARLPAVLPARVVDRFQNAPEIMVRMLLNHRSGIPDWLTPAVNSEIAHHPAKVWKVSEFLDLAAAQPPLFAPGTSFGYSNTDYNLLGLIIERLTRHSWRHEVTRRVLGPLGLRRTYLPAPGDRSIKGAHAHGYEYLDGKTVDFTGVDPSMAGAAGGGALVTTVQDLTSFLDALLNGRLFRHRATLRQMLAFGPAPNDGVDLVGYGLGIEQRVFPGGSELIGHLGATAGYLMNVYRIRHTDLTIASAHNSEDLPVFLIPAVQAIAATHP